MWRFLASFPSEHVILSEKETSLSHAVPSVGYKCSMLFFFLQCGALSEARLKEALVWNFIFSWSNEEAQILNISSLPFHAFVTKTCPPPPIHTPPVSYETNRRASSVSNWERLQGRASTQGETERLGVGTTFHRLTQQLVINPIRYGWRTHSRISISLFLLSLPSEHLDSCLHHS